jgi:nitrite reductase/ring-hydroxylating ferredoxin subunit
MVARLTRDEIVAQLEAHGLRFRTVTVQTDGDYLPSDVDWNNKDVLHLNHVHTLVKDVTVVVERDLQASISLQKALGITFPLVLVHFDSGPDRQTHIVTLLAWTIVTQHDFVPLTPTRTRAITSYTIGARPFWMLFFPLIERVVRRNYHRLMSEDVPLRERRGLLRSWGYTFRGDGAPRDIRASLNPTGNNVLPPDPAPVPSIDPIRLADLHENRWTFVGRADHLGLKLRREGRRVVAYPRSCPHEGADLDAAAVTDGCLTCPWHGRRLPPSAVLDLDDPDASSPTGRCRLRLDGEHLVVEPLVGSERPEADVPGD